MPSAPQQPQGMYQTPQPSSQFGQQQFPGVSQTYSPQPSSQFGQQSGSGFGMQQQQYPSVPQTQSPQPSTQFGQQQQQQFPGVAPQYGQAAGYPQAQSYGGQPYASKPKSADDLTPQELFAKVDKYKTGLIGINELKDAFKLLGSKFSGLFCFLFLKFQI